MTKWPNWIDLVIVIVIFKTAYNGFGRGVLAELLKFSGAVVGTAFLLNYWRMAADQAVPWIPLNPTLAAFLVFWGLFIILLVILHVVVKRLCDLMKWERLHWSIQGIGLILGGLRGLWWSGFMLLAMVLSGVPYLHKSVESDSVLGPRLAKIARTGFVQVADQLPGAQHRGEVLMPPAQSPPAS